MANRNDVARAAGVSGATVSRVFAKTGPVADHTRQLVIKTAKELGYSPNIVARNFVKRSSGNIGVVVPMIPKVHIFSVHYFSELLSGIGEALSETGFSLLLMFRKIDAQNVDGFSSFFSGGKVDGCILLGTTSDDRSFLLEEENHFCLINNYLKNKDISFIDTDNVYGSFTAVSYLRSLGHTKIALLNGPAKFTNSIDREKGYIQALKADKLPILPEFFLEGNYGYKSGVSAADAIIRSKNRPSAVFAANDRMAAGLIAGLKIRDIKVPEDISVVGYDDSDIASTTVPAITTVRVPFYEMGYECGIRFIELIRSKGEKRFQVFIKPELIIRDSTKKL
jgi:LacI family transcriptional regulator